MGDCGGLSGSRAFSSAVRPVVMAGRNRLPTKTYLWLPSSYSSSLSMMLKTNVRSVAFNENKSRVADSVRYGSRMARADCIEIFAPVSTVPLAVNPPTELVTVSVFGPYEAG